MEYNDWDNEKKLAYHKNVIVPVYCWVFTIVTFIGMVLEHLDELGPFWGKVVFCVCLLGIIVLVVRLFRWGLLDHEERCNLADEREKREKKYSIGTRYILISAPLLITTFPGLVLAWYEVFGFSFWHCFLLFVGIYAVFIVLLYALNVKDYTPEWLKRFQRKRKEKKLRAEAAPKN